MSAGDELRFLLIQAFSTPEGTGTGLRSSTGPKSAMLMNYELVAPLLRDVDWDVHPGPAATHGPSLVETREEFFAAAAARLPIVREACESGRYNGIVLLGGGDPGFLPAREIGRRFGIAVNACANAQMHIAAMLGTKFSVIDVSEPHSVYYRALIHEYGFTSKCASIRNLDCPLPRGGASSGVSYRDEKARVEAGQSSVLVDAAVEQAVAAIEDDGAEVFVFGCSALYWLAPILEQRLLALGWQVPVLEGYRSAIELTRLMVRLGVSASGLAFPGAPAPRARRVKRL
jgi:Asp/Glu/hydantoin racemase